MTKILLKMFMWNLIAALALALAAFILNTPMPAMYVAGLIAGFVIGRIHMEELVDHLEIEKKDGEK